MSHLQFQKEGEGLIIEEDLPDCNLNEYFGSSQDQNSQGTADVTSTKTPKKLEGAKSKNDPEGSSHRRIHKSPRGSAGEDSPEPSSNLKQSRQWAMKPESEDLSSSSSLSSGIESSDKEKVPMKEKMKESLPPPPKKKHRSQSPPHLKGKCSKS